VIRFTKRLWRSAPIATLILAGSLLVAAFFTVRATAFWMYWNDPSHRAQAVEPWMTPKYVAHSWQVPPDVVIEALGDFKRTKKGPMSLDQIAKSQGVASGDIVTAVQNAVHAFDAARPTPRTPPAPKDGS
jgi:hypothetical protein